MDRRRRSAAPEEIVPNFNQASPRDSLSHGAVPSPPSLSADSNARRDALTSWRPCLPPRRIWTFNLARRKVQGKGETVIIWQLLPAAAASLEEEKEAGTRAPEVTAPPSQLISNPR